MGHGHANTIIAMTQFFGAEPPAGLCQTGVLRTFVPCLLVNPALHLSAEQKVGRLNSRMYSPMHMRNSSSLGQFESNIESTAQLARS